MIWFVLKTMFLAHAQIRLDITFKLYDVNGSSHDIILNNALYVPSYKQDIFSVNAAVEEGGSISLDRHAKQFRSSNGSVFNIEQVGHLYYLNSISSSRNSACTLTEWHRILGHCNLGDIRKLEIKRCRGNEDLKLR